MRYISTFSGIEAATVAWEHLGWEPVAFSEIDPFPSAVLAHRFPYVPNLGDITKVDWSEYRGKKIDLIVGGSPCQSFSVAGRREGLQGESGLMFEYIRAVRELMPRCFLWENVPGALSSEKGEAFRQLLSEMDALGYGMAWRVLDAQFFGVPQRRERIFLVGCLGDPRRAAEILFERESMRWSFASSREKRKELAEAAGRGAASRGGAGDRLTAKTMQVRCGCEGGGKGALIQDEMSATLSTSNNQTLFAPSFCLQGNMVGRSDTAGPQGAGVNEETSFRLNTTDRHAVAYRQGGFADYVEGEVGTLKASGGDLGGGSETIICEPNGMAASYIVRRLTPRECERLQGFPDDWTLIPYRGKEAADGPRYKAIGNSMAVPVMRWIGERIAKAYGEK